jgi:ABC-type sugar transport system ATPase subunit
VSGGGNRKGSCPISSCAPEAPALAHRIPAVRQGGNAKESPAQRAAGEKIMRAAIYQA